MDIAIAFLAGAAVALWARRAWAKARVPAVTVAPQAAAPDPVGRIQELTPALAAAGEASAHPRDLLANDTFRAAVALLASPDVPLGVVTDYACGANYAPACAALAALGERPDRHEAEPVIQRHFRHLLPWPVYFALQYFLSLPERAPLGAVIVNAPPWAAEHPLVVAMLAEHVAARSDLGDAATFGGWLSAMTPTDGAAADTLLRRISHSAAATLAAELSAWRHQAIDRTYLQSFGRFVDTEEQCELLVEHGAFREQLAGAEAVALQQPFRSLLVVGEPRVGKTSFLMLLARRASARGWTVFEAGAASLMAGQQYFGQLEERLHRLPAELSVDKRVLWYIPDFAQFAASGTHSGQAASLLDQVLPSIVAGRIVVVSETTPAGLTALLQRRPSLRSAVELVRLSALPDEDVNRLIEDFASALMDGAGISIDGDVVAAATHLARHYLGSGQMPGAALDLLKLSAQRVGAHDRTLIGRQDLLATLAQLTGMPQLVLDDRERVDLASLRAFFSARVIGQDEAVDVVVDRIAMLKSGLTDPAKPIGVFLFAGPTGTGKTELAKTLAAFLFGSDDRLIRLDMSEFQTYESTRKILGDPEQQADAQALTQRIRKQPFAVVLLDEFEKAHANVWDLFLQVFDDGRLTDAMGQTVDFRHCIIILTSNLGATIKAGAGVGFASQSGTFSPDHVMRAVHQSFRPEFVNRLDAIIVFRPLTRELMRGILAKELAAVLERRGLRHRDWAVEWESSALDFLLDKGFSPTMGARPLKRAIDRHVLAPLAATLVEHRFPEGDQFLFVRSDGKGIQVEFVDPDARDEPPATLDAPAGPGLPLPRLMLQATGDPRERAALDDALARVERRLSGDAWSALENELAALMARDGFWNDRGRFHVLARYALTDRVKAAAGTARALAARLARAAGKHGRHSRDLIARLAAQIHVVELGIEDALTDAPVEVAISVQPVLDGGRDAAAGARWCERLLEMYRSWAGRRNAQWDVVAPGGSSEPAICVASGFGAARVLTAEAGLHVLEPDDAQDDRERSVARVRVVPTPDAPEQGAPEVRKTLTAALNAAPGSAAVVRRYRLGGAPLVRDVARGWRTGRADVVLGGDFDLLADVLPSD